MARKRVSVAVAAGAVAISAVLGAIVGISLAGADDSEVPSRSEAEQSRVNESESKGPLPIEAMSPGLIDTTVVPDFVETLDRRGQLAGYVEARALLDPERQEEVLPVYGEDLRTIVGHMHPGRGFVPLGGEPNDVEPFDINVGTIEEVQPEAD